MKDQIKVHRVGSEIELQVRDQSIVIWNDEAARHVAEEILKLTEPEKPETIATGTKVVVGRPPEGWEDDYWPEGQTATIIETYQWGSGESHYVLDFDDENVEVLNQADFFLAEDFTIAGPR